MIFYSASDFVAVCRFYCHSKLYNHRGKNSLEGKKPCSSVHFLKPLQLLFESLNANNMKSLKTNEFQFSI